MYKIDAVYLTTPDSVSIAHMLVWFGPGVRFERRSIYRTVVTLSVFNESRTAF